MDGSCKIIVSAANQHKDNIVFRTKEQEEVGGRRRGGSIEMNDMVTAQGGVRVKKKTTTTTKSQKNVKQNIIELELVTRCSNSTVHTFCVCVLQGVTAASRISEGCFTPAPSRHRTLEPYWCCNLLTCVTAAVRGRSSQARQVFVTDCCVAIVSLNHLYFVFYITYSLCAFRPGVFLARGLRCFVLSLLV